VITSTPSGRIEFLYPTAEKVGNAKVAGATPMWEWAGNDTTIFSY